MKKIDVFKSLFKNRALKKIKQHKILVVTTLVIFMWMANGHSALAQFNQGRMLVGGAVAFSSLTTKDDAVSTDTKSTSLSLTPNVGYFVIDNLALGLDVSFTTQKDTQGASTSKSTGILAGPFVRYYLKPGIFFQGEYQFGSEKFTFEGAPFSGEFKENLSAWALSVGYAWFLNDHIAIEPMISYKSVSANEKDVDYKATNSGLNIGIGFQIYLGKSVD